MLVLVYCAIDALDHVSFSVRETCVERMRAYRHNGGGGEWSNAENFSVRKASSACAVCLCILDAIRMFCVCRDGVRSLKESFFYQFKLLIIGDAKPSCLAAQAYVIVPCKNKQPSFNFTTSLDIAHNDPQVFLEIIINMMSDGGTSTPISKAGITSSESGESFIPSSTRADGSVRKEIRVRPGYKPPEDVEVYKNRTAQGWKSRGTGGPPGAEFLQTEEKKKKTTRRGKKNTAANTNKAEDDAAANVNGTHKVTSANGVKAIPQNKKAEEAEAESETEDPEVTKQKEARKLSKKLRQARDLQQKKEEGGGLLPEQFQKVIKINEIIRQLDQLGFDYDGQRKPDG